MSHSQRTDRCAGARRGVAAVEFALVAPFIMLLMLGGTDLTIFMRTKMRVDETATQVALAVTQYQNLYDSDFTILFNAAQTIAGTTPVTGLFGTTIITGIVTDTNDRQTIAWQKRSTQATFNSLFGTAKGSVPNLPNSYLMPHASPHFTRDIKESVGHGDASGKNHGTAVDSGLLRIRGGDSPLSLNHRIWPPATPSRGFDGYQATVLLQQGPASSW
jgi:Flp pilus assembly protein TadG